MKRPDSKHSTVTADLTFEAPSTVARLLVVHGAKNAVGASRVVSHVPLTLGRASPSLPLDDLHASRAHASLRREGDTVQLEDLGSHNGTFVNGARVERATLSRGDVVRVGTHLFVLQVLEPEDVKLFLGLPAEAQRPLGASAAMHAARDAILRCAKLPVPVLLLGETGVGKEVVARALHEQSGRPGPFVAVNLAAVSAELAESELFGHTRGAFTGAHDTSKGLFGEADGGTLLLDELGDAPPALQATLLRALATGEVRRVGEATPRKVDVRVVAATHVDLAAAVERGAFRRDLLARVSGQIVHLPPLRERREDVLLLFEDLLTRAGAASCELTADCAEALLLAQWPHNVRELEQLARVLAPLTAQRPLEVDDLPPAIALPVSSRRRPVRIELAQARVLEVRRDTTPSEAELRLVLAQFEGNVSRVARFFGKERRQIYRWAERFGIVLDGSRED